MRESYIQQATLLVRCLPAVAEESCFCLKGGTALNLFLLDLPRLSVDIDLVYVPIEPRDDSFRSIHEALNRIAERLRKLGAVVNVSKDAQKHEKLLVTSGGTTIKIEPNYVVRGTIAPPQARRIATKAEDRFGFATCPVLAPAELWGGKICAALDRRHPRDLFDIKHLLDGDGISPAIVHGFLFMLMNHNRNPYELLRPLPHDDMGVAVFEREFVGMSDEPFNQTDFAATSSRLVLAINNGLRPNDKELLHDFFSLASFTMPDWCPRLPDYPGIAWKLANLRTLREHNKRKFMIEVERLDKAIGY